MTSSMTSWIYIYKIVVIISWYIYRGSLMMISLLCCIVIMKNVVISFIKEYRGPTLRPPCDVIDDVIIMKILFWHNFGTIFSYLMSNWSCVWYFKSFKIAAILSSQHTFFTESYTGRWIYQNDSHEHYRYFELLINALAQILMEIYQF